MGLGDFAKKAVGAVSQPLSIVGKGVGERAGIGNKLEGLFSSAGVTDPDFQRFLSLGAAGSGTEERIRAERERIRREEAETRAFNQEILSLAEGLSGRLASPDLQGFDLDQLQFQGADPRQGQLQALVESFRKRQGEIQEQRFTPGLSQTRLALVD